MVHVKLGGRYADKKATKNARQLQSMVISKINDPTHHLTTLFGVNNLSYDDLREIYHYINAVVMFNTIPAHEHLTKKTKQVLFNAGVYADDDTLNKYRWNQIAQYELIPYMTERLHKYFKH